MMKITADNYGEVTMFKLEGALTGEWVGELLRCWQQALITERPHIRVDLSGVSYVSETGKELLSEMYRTGADLVAAGVLMKALVEEIIRESAL
jgi:anti-anti-sigma regulatory factor